MDMHLNTHLIINGMIYTSSDRAIKRFDRNAILFSGVSYRLLEWLNPEPLNSDPDTYDDVVSFRHSEFLKQTSLQKQLAKVLVCGLMMLAVVAKDLLKRISQAEDMSEYNAHQFRIIKLN